MSWSEWLLSMAVNFVFLSCPAFVLGWLGAKRALVLHRRCEVCSNLVGRHHKMDCPRRGLV